MIRGENLKKMDLVGTVDSFIEIEHGGLKLVSTTISNDQNPVWEEELYLPISLPTVNNRIVCRLFDNDGLKDSEIMGSFSFNV